ncbi:MAG: TspO/MBR family protein [Nodosilinea sp.]
MTTSRNHSQPGIGLAIATVVAIVGTLVVNTLSNIFPPGGKNVGEIANTILQGVLITPANYAFAIWGVIYLGLIAYGLYQLNPERRRKAQIQQVNKLLIGACIAQIIWIFLFTLQQFWWSLLAMLVILLTLVGIYLTLDIGHGPVSRRRRWMAHIPFSLYLGWIAVATIVNVASTLYVSGWSGWGISAVTWTAIMIVVAALVAEVVIFRRGDVAFTLVFVWAFVAIAVRQQAIPVLQATALIAAAVLLAWLVWVKAHAPRLAKPQTAGGVDQTSRLP